MSPVEGSWTPARFHRPALNQRLLSARAISSSKISRPPKGDWDLPMLALEQEASKLPRSHLHRVAISRAEASFFHKYSPFEKSAIATRLV